MKVMVLNATKASGVYSVSQPSNTKKSGPVSRIPSEAKKRAAKEGRDQNDHSICRDQGGKKNTPDHKSSNKATWQSYV